MERGRIEQRKENIKFDQMIWTFFIDNTILPYMQLGTKWPV